MTTPLAPTPRSEALGAVPMRPAGDAGNDAVAAPEYTTAAPPRIPCLMTWLRCHQCCRGFFASGAPRPHPCPMCAGGRLLPMGLWDLCPAAAPAVMFQRGEV
jgi:hypothetical protein